MAGLFGGRITPEMIMMIGAGLKDASAGGSDNLAAAQKMLGDQRQQKQQAALMGELAPFISGGQGGAGGAGAGLPPDLLARMALSGMKGVDSLIALRGQDMPNMNVDGGSGEVYNAKDGGLAGRRFARPDIVNNVVIDEADPKNLERTIPQVDKGQMVVFDGQNRPMVINLPNATRAAAEMAGAVKGAEAAATSPYEFESFTDGQGRPVRAAKSTIAGQQLAGQTPEEAAFSQSRGTQQAGKLTELETSVREGQTALSYLNSAQEALNAGAITGAGADARLNIERGLALIGDKAAAQRVQATETFRSLAGRQVLEVVKGLGAGTGISNADRDFAERIAGGSIDLNRETINRLMDIQRRAIEGRERQLQEMKAGAPTGRPASGGGRGYTVVGVRRAE